MTSRTYVPDAGDIVWLQFDPQAGHEQSGHRPALVMSPRLYNGTTGLLICCPMTTQVKGYPFEVVTQVGKQQEVVLADQVKSLDWKIRRARKNGTAPDAVMLAVRARIKALLAIK